MLLWLQHQDAPTKAAVSVFQEPELGAALLRDLPWLVVVLRVGTHTQRKLFLLVALTSCCWNLWHRAVWSRFTAALLANLVCSASTGVTQSSQTQSQARPLAVFTDHTPAGLAFHQLVTARAAQKPGGECSWIFNTTAFNSENVLPGLFKPQETRMAVRGSAPQNSIQGQAGWGL